MDQCIPTNVFLRAHGSRIYQSAQRHLYMALQAFNDMSPPRKWRKKKLEWWYHYQLDSTLTITACPRKDRVCVSLSRVIDCLYTLPLIFSPEQNWRVVVPFFLAHGGNEQIQGTHKASWATLSSPSNRFLIQANSPVISLSFCFRSQLCVMKCTVTLPSYITVPMVRMFSSVSNILIFTCTRPLWGHARCSISTSFWCSTG